MICQEFFYFQLTFLKMYSTMLSATFETLQVKFDKRKWCGDRKVPNPHKIAVKIKTCREICDSNCFKPKQLFEKAKIKPNFN